MKKILEWKQKNIFEFWLLVGILLLSTVLRLWRIDEYLPFLGDEGRDVRVVSRFVKDFDLMFIGPRTSIGDMYLGPMYYYFIAPFLFLWNFSPAGPASFVALLSTATVALIWFTAKEWFGRVAGIVAALLYAVSPLVISFARHSWNPNIMPFFSLLAVYSIWRVWKVKNWKWLIVTGFSFSAMVQSHYLGLLILPVIGVFWILTLIEIRKTKNLKSFFIFSGLSIALFIILISPLAIFDSKHGWHNFSSMKKFFTERQTTVSAKPWNAIPTIYPSWKDELVERLLLAKNTMLSTWLAPILALGIVLLGYLGRYEKQKLMAHLLIGIWIVTGLLGLGLLKQNIYDHYYGFLFPTTFLIVGALAQEFWKGKLKWFVVLGVFVLLFINLTENPLKYPPQRQMQRVQEVDKKIIEESKGEPFNFALIAERNYEEGYLYFLEQWNAPIREIDPNNTEKTLTKQLFVVCEDQKCEPINHPKAEIAHFGWSKIEQEWQISGVRLFKLVHNPQ